METGSSQAGDRRPAAAGRLALAAAAAAIILGFGLLNASEIRMLLLGLRDWATSLGAWGPVVFGIGYAVAIVCLVPGNLMTPLAVGMFGSVVAVITVSLGGLLGSTIAFLISRYALRDDLCRLLSRNPRFRTLEEQTSLRGPLYVAVARALPVLPANLLHYAFGLTRVSLGDFVFWSWLCSLPGLTFAVALLGTAFSVFDGQALSPLRVAMLALLLSVQVGLIRWASRQSAPARSAEPLEAAPVRTR